MAEDTEANPDPENDWAGPSKSQVKREMLALRSLGARIADLTPGQRADLPLGARLRAALEEYDRLRAREARRRHLSFIGKVMRDEDIDAIRSRLDRVDAASAAHARELHTLEAWREALLEDDAQLAVFIDAHPQADRQRLRQLIRASRKEAGGEGERRHYRDLFRCLREATAELDGPVLPPK